jgi:uncharacterized repeat protein (TIGR01451 family)
MLMSYAALYSSASIPVTITFDQNASTAVPAVGSLATGSNQPAAYNSPSFPTNLTSISPPHNTNLSVFEGVPPNGWWYLYAYDSKAGDYGAILNGWSVAVTTITPVNQIADVGVSIAASTNWVVPGGNVTFAITLANLGTNAPRVLLTNVLDSGLTFIPGTNPAYAPSQITNQTQIYNTNGVLPGQTNLTLSFLASVSPNIQTNNTVLHSVASIGIGSQFTDPNTNNKTASASVTVFLQADVSAGISSSAGSHPAVLGSNVVYTLAVTNNGPNLALNVKGLLTQCVSGSTNIVLSTNFSFGGIAPGSIASVLFTNKAPSTPGWLTNTWTVSTDSTNSNPANAAATLALAVTYPEPVLVAAGANLLSQSFAPSSGVISPTETATVAFTLQNVGAAPATNLTATLLSTNGVVALSPASQNYGAIAAGASATTNFAFTTAGVPGSAITAVLSLADNAYPLGTVSFTFANSIPLSLNFANTAGITIPDSGPGTPYPSEIAVSAANLVIGKVTATLQGFTHSFPHDVNILLAGPSGQQAVLMAHAGGPYSVTNLVLAFDDASTNSLTEASLVSATNHSNHPTQILPLDSFPGLSGQPSNTNLSVFNGGNPNGIWSLYVYDDTPGNDGDIANGWTLGLTLVNPINLGLGMTHTPDPVFMDNLLTFQITVTNLGPSGATNVLLTDTLPAASSLVWAAASQGTVNTNVNGVVTFNLGVITNVGDTAGAALQVQPLQTGLASNFATVTNAAASSATASNTVTVLNAAPFFLEATNVANNLRLTLEGSAGQSYIIQVSTNLVSWTSVSTNLAVSPGLFTFTNNLTNVPALFYRALHLPQ